MNWQAADKTMRDPATSVRGVASHTADCGLSRRDDSVVVRVDDRGSAVAQIEFDEDPARLALDDERRDEEFVGDLGVGATRGYQR